MKKQVSWVQPNYHNGSKKWNSYYLPYSAGILWAYANQFEEITSRYEIGTFIWRRDPIVESLEKIKNSSVVGFSTYVWNRQYNLKLAEELKKVNPNCFIIFGGPEVPITDSKLFERYPFIDCAVKKEGEIVLKKILDVLGDIESIKNIPGLLINENQKVYDTGVAERIMNLEDIPSPYLTGVFDGIIKENPEVQWSVVYEPDRGCPYACTYCDWGSLTYNKVRKFELQRLYDELEWFAENNCMYLMIANANFGIFVERDNLIADKIIEIKNRTGFPLGCYISWAKNQQKEVINIAEKLKDITSFAISSQTLTDSVLENVKRVNLEISKAEQTFQLCEAKNIPIHTELIMGLPGESFESWKETIWKLFKAGNHGSISFYQAQILENSEMNLLQRKLHKIKSVPVYDYLAGTRSFDEEIIESIQVVVETNATPLDKMIETLVFTAYVNALHVNGISTFWARYLEKAQNVGYGQFYEEFYTELLTDEWFKKQIDDTRMYYTRWVTDGFVNHEPIGGGVEMTGINLYQRISINVYQESKREHMLNLTEKFIQKTFDIEQEVYEELKILQRTYFLDFNDIDNLPKKIRFKHDYVRWLLNQCEFDTPAEYLFEFRMPRRMSLDLFCEQIYYQRRKEVTKTRITVL